MALPKATQAAIASVLSGSDGGSSGTGQTNFRANAYSNGTRRSYSHDEAKRKRDEEEEQQQARERERQARERSGPEYQQQRNFLAEAAEAGAKKQTPAESKLALKENQADAQDRKYAREAADKKYEKYVFGKYGNGNIDLTDRNTGLFDEDGKIKTVNSMSFNEDGQEILVPTVVKKDGKWTQLTDDEARDWYHQTGEYLGKFDSVEESNAYAKKLHEQQDEMYGHIKPSVFQKLKANNEELNAQIQDPNAWGFLQEDQQANDLVGGWGKQYGGGVTMSAGSGIYGLYKSSDNKARYEYDKIFGQGAYDKAMVGAEKNPFLQASEDVFNTGMKLQQSGEEDWARGTENMSDTGKMVANVVKTGTDVAADAALNTVAPGMGTLRMYMGAAGGAAYEQSQRENNDPDSILLSSVKGALNAYLSNKLVGGLGSVYGESVLGKATKDLLKGASPEVQKVLGVLLNSEGVEEGLEDILNWAADRILGLDTGTPLDWNEVKQDAFIGYILGVITNGLAGGMNIDSKMRQNIGQGGLEFADFAEQGGTIEEAAEIGKQNTKDQVVMKAAPEPEAETTSEPEVPDITPSAEMPTTEAPTQQNNGNGAWEGWKGWVQETLSGGPLSDEDIDAIYRRDAARQAFEELTGISLEGMTEEDAKSTIGMAAGTMNTGANPEQTQTAEPTQETTANNETPEAEAAPEGNDTTGTNPEQETQQTAENQQQNEGNPNPDETAEPNPNQKQDQKRKTDHTKKVEGPDENTNEAFDKLNEEHGSIDKGENPARDINVPKKDTKGNKVGEGARTVFEADATPEERVASLKAAVVNGNFGHIPVTNDTRSKGAASKLAKDGWAKSVADFRAAVESGKADADMIALGAHLINEAGNSTECSGKTYIDLVMAYNDAVSDAGSRLAAGRILKTLTPEGKLYGIEKTIEKMNKDIRKNNEKRGPKRQKAEIKLDEQLVEDYLNAKTDEERNEIHDKIIKDAADQVPNTFRDKFTALRYLNMLGNFKTQTRNFFGNLGMGTVQKVKNEMRGGIEGIVKAATGGKYDQQYKGGIGLAKRLKVASEDFISDADLKALAMGEKKFSDIAKQSESEIMDAKKPFSDKHPLGKFLNLYNDLTGKAMEFGDAIFVRATYADALAGYMNAHGITEADWKAMVADPKRSAEVDKARAFAIKQAQEATFRDTNAVSKFASTFDSRWPNLAKKGAQGIIPFRKTPANVLVRMEEYSPLGTLNTIYKGIQAAKGTAEVSEVIDSAAKTVTGSGLAYLGYLLASMKMARTKDDDKNEEALAKLRGQQDYSIEIGGKSITMDWLSPASAPFFMGVEAYNLSKDGGFRPADFLNVAMSITNPMLEMSMLSGVNDALSNLSDFEGDNSAMMQFVLNSAWSYLTQGISNTLLGQMEQFSEKNRQTYYTDADNPLLPTWAQKKIAKLGNKTPGKDYQAADYIDAWGRKQANDADLKERAWNVFLNPGYVSKLDEKATKADSVIESLYQYGKTQKDHDSFPSVVPKTPSRTTTVNGVKLTPEEYDEYATIKGQESLKNVVDFIESDQFKKMDEYQQAETISDIYSYASFLAASKIAESRGEKYYDEKYSPLLTGQKEDGENTYKAPIKADDIPEYLGYMNAYNDAMNKKDYDVVDALINSSKSLPESARVGVTQHAENMEKLAGMKEAGLSSAKVYYQFNDDMREIYESEKRTDPKSSDYIRVAGSGKYSPEDADAIMGYERKVSEQTIERYQDQVQYSLDKAGKSGLYNTIWNNIEKCVEGDMTTDEFNRFVDDNVPLEYRQNIKNVRSKYTSDTHIAGKTISGIYRAMRDVGYSPEVALQFFDMIDTNYNESYTKAEFDKACKKAFGNSDYGKQVRKLIKEYVGK